MNALIMRVDSATILRATMFNFLLADRWHIQCTIQVSSINQTYYFRDIYRSPSDQIDFISQKLINTEELFVYTQNVCVQQTEGKREKLLLPAERSTRTTRKPELPFHFIIMLEYRPEHTVTASPQKCHDSHFHATANSR